MQHDRGDYLHGWQLDNAYLSEQPCVDRTAAVSADLLRSAAVREVVEEEPLPFACLICREPFTEPVVTRCGHYFDMQCALQRYARNSKCAACGAATNGASDRLRTQG